MNEREEQGQARSLMCLKCSRRGEKQKDIIPQYNDPWNGGWRDAGGEQTEQNKWQLKVQRKNK